MLEDLVGEGLYWTHLLQKISTKPVPDLLRKRAMGGREAEGGSPGGGGRSEPVHWCVKYLCLEIATNDMQVRDN